MNYNVNSRDITDLNGIVGVGAVPSRSPISDTDTSNLDTKPMSFVDIKIDSSDDEHINDNNNNKKSKLNRNSTLLNISGCNNFPNTFGGAELLPTSLSTAPAWNRDKNFLFKFKPKSTATNKQQQQNQLSIKAKSLTNSADSSSLNKAADLLLAQLDLDIYDDDDDDLDNILDDDDDENDEVKEENENGKRQLSKSMSHLSNSKLFNELNNFKMTTHSSGVDFLNSTLNGNEQQPQQQYLESCCMNGSKFSIDHYSSIDCIDKVTAGETNTMNASSSSSIAANNGIETTISTERSPSSLKPKSDSSSHR
jgi:hypothetical protein